MTHQQMLEAEARRTRGIMTAASIYITDAAQASTVPAIYPYWAKGDWADYKLGRIVRMRDETLWRMNQPALADASQNLEPGSLGSEAIWSQVSYKNGVRIIPDMITSTTAFSLDELGWWHGSAAVKEGVYKSGQAGNSFPPGTVGALWTHMGADDEAEEPVGPTEPTEPDTGGELTPDLPKGWDVFAANHLFNVGDEFSDGGKVYAVLRQFNKLDHYRPPALIDNFYKVKT